LGVFDLSGITCALNNKVEKRRARVMMFLQFMDKLIICKIKKKTNIKIGKKTCYNRKFPKTNIDITTNHTSLFHLRTPDW
jgi:hypothetical protein